MTRREQLFICIGLLLITTPTLINDWIKLPDFFRGLLSGVGLALEICGLVLIAKRKKNRDLTDL